MRKYGFGGYSIYRYLVNEALHQGDYFLPWCEETAEKPLPTGILLWKMLPGL